MPWYHWLGGAPEDQRFRNAGRDFFQWIAAHEPHFVNRKSVAGVAVVTVVCSRLEFNLATAVLLYLIVVVLVSLSGSFAAATLVALTCCAGLCRSKNAPSSRRSARSL